MRELRLTVTSPAQTFTDPITRAEAEAFLRLPELSPEDAARNALVDALITGAREQAEIFQNRDLVQKQWDLYLDSFGSDIIELRRDLISVDLVQYTNYAGTTATLTENTDFVVDAHRQPGIIRPAYGVTWPSFTPSPSAPILIRFIAGLAASELPAPVRVGMLELISHWYTGRLPFEVGIIKEYPFTISTNLRFRSKRRVPRGEL